MLVLILIADATAIRLGIAPVDAIGGRRATRSEDTAGHAEGNRLHEPA